MAPVLLLQGFVEFLFKKHFWLVRLTFIFLGLFLVMRGVNAFVEASLTPLPSGQTSGPVKREEALVLPPLNIDLLAKVTGLPVPKPEPEVKEPSAPVVDLNAEPVRSGLRVKLLGTLLAGLPEWSIASIQDVTTLRAKTYMIGDDIMGATVQDIQRLRVIVINGGRREFIDGTPGDGAPVALPPVAMVAPPAGGGGTGAPPSNVLGQGVRELAENQYEIPKAEIDRTLSNLNDVAMQARIVPAFKDGAAQGFKLFSIRPDSIYSKIGIQNGDVIKRINGFDLNSPEKALEVYTKLKEASRIDIEVERNGASVRKTYNIK